MGAVSYLTALPWLLLVVGGVLAIMTLWRLYRYLGALAALKEGEVLVMRRKMLDSLKSTSSENQG